MRAGRAVRAAERRPALRRAHRRAARALGQRRPHRDRADGRRSRRRALRVPPRLPRERARPGLRLRALGAAPERGRGAGRLRARRGRPRPPWGAGAPVLAFLRLQRLEQPPRGRLGDDPAPLRGRGRGRGARRRADEDRLQPARGRRGGRVGRGQARARRRDAPRRPPGRRLARELLRGGALPRQLGRAGRRLRRHERPDCRPPSDRDHDPGRPGRRAGGVSLDRLPGPVGRASARLLQRPHGPQPEDTVDGARHLVRGLARPELCGPGRRRARNRGD